MRPVGIIVWLDEEKKHKNNLTNSFKNWMQSIKYWRLHKHKYTPATYKHSLKNELSFHTESASDYIIHFELYGRLYRKWHAK